MILSISKGFTLVELMVVMAIIGVLAAFALPSYSIYVKKTYVAEGIQLAGALKSGMVMYYAVNSSWPSSNTEARVSSTIQKGFLGSDSNIVQNIETKGEGIITITYGDRISSLGAIVYIKGSAPNNVLADNAAYTWKCESGSDVMNVYVPSTCDLN